jgi:hypothetical protein
MSLSKKYDVPEEKITAMIKDGVIPWGVLRIEEIISRYKNHVSSMPKCEAVKCTSDEIGVSKTYVYDVVKRFVDGK